MKLNHALSLASRGFWVFPIVANGKTPAVKDWQEKASRDPEQIRKWFADSDKNIGVYTGKFGDNQALVVVDVDNKHGKNGDAAIFNLELEGHELPCTFEQSTPSGGRHIIYVADEAHRQGVDVLGSGLDIRSRGGYIVGPGSTIDGKQYAQINGHGTLAPAPQWLCHRLGVDRVRAGGDRSVLPGIDPDRAVARAVAYLVDAPLSEEGNAGDITAFRVAAKLKDLGCTQDQALDLMLAHWNNACCPPWEPEDLAVKVANAFDYGREPQGVDAVEAVFDAVDVPDEPATGKTNPVLALNQKYALVKKGGFVMEETTDQDGNFELRRMSVGEFNLWHANDTMQIEDKKVPVSKLWLNNPQRRQYEAVVFEPGRQIDSRYYNLWSGFTVRPADKLDMKQPGLAAFIEHARENVCNGDLRLFHWLMCWLAQLIQRPDAKPLVALVFKGQKGTGKNALIERVGFLLGKHFTVADDDRYLLSNFNSHLEDCLALVLDEACWAGDKKAEGKLKGVITGQHHQIERKGQEAYKAKNLTRVVIIGNENWLVPATEDERRFAVFNIGNGRRKDRKFFENMRLDLEAGGYTHLLRYLLDYKITADVNDAPDTAGLVEQKIASLDLVAQWWHACLHDGEIAGGDFDGWPELIPTKRAQAAFERYAKSRNVRARLPEAIWFGRELNKMGVERKRRAKAEDGSTYAYILKPLADMREDFSRHIGGDINWPEE